MRRTRALLSTVSVLIVGSFFVVGVSSISAAPAPVRITFETPNLRGIEGNTVALRIRSSARLRQPVEVRLVVEGSASVVADALPADLAIQATSITLTKGTTSFTVPVTLVADGVPELDEQVTIRLVDAVGSPLAPKGAATTLTIVDRDRRLLVNVRGAGAVGDGRTDDTIAVQRAVGQVRASGGGVVEFPPGRYLVTSVNISEGISYVGRDATIVRPAGLGNGVRTFTTQNVPYEGDTDSRLLLLSGLTFDGSSSTQGPYRSYERQQAHLVFLTASPRKAGRLKSIVQDVRFQNGVADGLSLFTNTDTVVNRVRGEDLFRGAVVLTGGYSKLLVTNLVTTGQTDATGLDVEVDARGFGGTFRVDVVADTMDLDSDFDISVEDGSTVLVSNTTVGGPPFFLSARNSTMTIRNSTLAIGGADQYSNRIVYPGQLTFERVKFQVGPDRAVNPKVEFFGLDIWWVHPSGPPSGDQQVRMSESSFELVGGAKPSRAIVSRYRRDGKDLLDASGATIGQSFDVREPVDQ